MDDVTGCDSQGVSENATVIFLHRGSECTLRALLNLSKQAQFCETSIFKLSEAQTAFQEGVLSPLSPLSLLC